VTLNGLDSMPAAEPEPRLELIRELVDQLPEQQALVVSLYFFGAGPVTLKRIAEETQLTTYQVKRLLSNAFDTLRAQLLEDDEVGTVPAGDVARIRALLGAPAVGTAGHDT
jgi:DNA-directed RNA polymerase sigma subunit (sigma70/sigma32)